MTQTQDALVLGTRPDSLTVLLVAGDPWLASLVLADANDAPKAWPVAPLLEFAFTLTGDTEPLTLTATLAPDPVEATANAMATWELTEDQVDQLCAKKLTRVRLSVDGATWYSGRTSCQS